MEQIIEAKLIQTAQILEQQLDSELDKLDKLDEDDIEQIRRKRILEMQKFQKEKEVWRANSHGQYTELTASSEGGGEKVFFECCKKSKRVVIHFYKQSTERCKIFDKHLAILATKHLECRFVKMDVEKAPFLTRRLTIRVIPTLCVVIDEKTKDYVVGFDDLGGRDDYSTEMLEWRLGQSGVIDYHGDLMTPPDDPRAKGATGGSVKSILGVYSSKGKSSIRNGKGDDNSDSDNDW